MRREFRCKTRKIQVNFGFKKRQPADFGNSLLIPVIGPRAAADPISLKGNRPNSAGR